MTEWKFYVIGFGNIVNGEREYESGCSMLIKAWRELSIEEAERCLKEDMKSYGCNCVCDVCEVNEEEAYDNYYVDNIDSWPIFG